MLPRCRIVNALIEDFTETVANERFECVGLGQALGGTSLVRLDTNTRFLDCSVRVGAQS